MKKLLAAFLSMALAVTVFTACGDKDDDNDKKSGSKVITEDDLNDANAKAKTTYNAVSGVVVDKSIDTQGALVINDAIYNGNSTTAPAEGDADFAQAVYDALSDNGDEAGEVFVGTTTINGNANALFVQWRLDEDSKLIGQYPNKVKNVKDMPEWGVYKD